MKNWSEHISHFLDQQGISASSSFLIACSGGVDSMLLAELMLQSGIEPALAHCNFQLRGDEADKDQKLVEDFAKQKGLPFFTTNFNTTEYSKEQGISIQMAARELRYSFFEKIMNENSIEYLCTAHHADDSLETILLNLGRGTGLPGLSGIPPKRDNILRPLSAFTKAEIIELAKELNLRWREDASNTKTDYQRNYLRHKIIPGFKENFPGFDKSFKKTQQQLISDAQLFQGLISEKLSELEEKTNDEKRISTARLTSIDGYASLLHHWLTPYGSFDLPAILSCIGGESGRMFASSTHRLLIDRTQLILKPISATENGSFQILESDATIYKPFDLSLQTLGAGGFTISTNSATAALDKAKLKFPLTLRKWKEGDYFYPLGMKGKKKLSDFFTDQKLSLFEKDKIWVLTSGEDIVWIVNHRIDDRYKISDTTKTIYFARLI